MRLKSSIWAAAYIRRCQSEGIFAVLRRRGAEEAGAIFVKVSRLDGTADLFGPAPQSLLDDADPTERRFAASFTDGPRTEDEVEGYLRRQLSFDPDVWIIEVEDREGRHFIDTLIT